MFKKPTIYSFIITDCGRKVGRYSIAVTDGPKENPGYLIYIIYGQQNFSLTIPYAPSERYLLALGDFIRASVTRLEDCRGITNEFMANEHRKAVIAKIRRFCFKTIEQDSIKRLNEGTVTAEHHYLCCDTMPAPNKEGQSRVLVNTYKNGVLIDTLDCKALQLFLKEHPETPIYQTADIEAVENVVLAAADVTVVDKVLLFLLRSQLTAGERFRDNFAKIKDEELSLFTKEGVVLPALKDAA